MNGKYVGYSEDSKVAAEFNISKYLKPGKNLIAMQVMRWCDAMIFLPDGRFFVDRLLSNCLCLYSVSFQKDTI